MGSFHIPMWKTARRWLPSTRIYIFGAMRRVNLDPLHRSCLYTCCVFFHHYSKTYSMPFWLHPSPSALIDGRETEASSIYDIRQSGVQSRPLDRCVYRRNMPSRMSSSASKQAGDERRSETLSAAERTEFRQRKNGSNDIHDKRLVFGSISRDEGFYLQPYNANAQARLGVHDGLRRGGARMASSEPVSKQTMPGQAPVTRESSPMQPACRWISPGLCAVVQPERDFGRGNASWDFTG
ncbi:uncharacterized protein RCC_01402 [Ramularia collo-cygni]|uniref:Uncharacterized protein n=1 Tax=Ramularia collo-cygni TaxID=112498 RepID=A0A2D3UP58_9PEZI|nr:uncharacterized protein RCC_01402 [Ramularia collo-cygni]CZT15548.1 uncharacterized protein RCC_01402 [Ramularia collo-cygni]